MKSRNSAAETIETDTKLSKIYTLHRKLSNGCFGYLYLVTNKQSARKAALKIEIIKHDQSLTLKKQYSLLKKLEGIKGVPAVYNYELQLLESDLSFLASRDMKDDYSFICHVACEMLEILEKVHSRGVIHRDLKPQNMMIDKENNVYLIDFGISKEKTKNEQSKRTSFVGTPRYASINAHRGKQQNNIDDLESLMYNIIFLAKKSLPWVNIAGDCGAKKLEAILGVKLKKSRSELCKDLPRCFLNAFDYIAKLAPQEKPNYTPIIAFFKEYKVHEIKTEKMFTKAQKLLEVEEPKEKRRASIDNYGFLAVPLTDTAGMTGSAEIPYSQKVVLSAKSLKQVAESDMEEEEDMFQGTITDKMVKLTQTSVVARFRVST